MSTSGTTARRSGTSVGGPAGPGQGEERKVLLRAVADSITGRGRLLGPAGTWVRVDFEDLRGQLRAG